MLLSPIDKKCLVISTVFRLAWILQLEQVKVLEFDGFEVVGGEAGADHVRSGEGPHGEQETVHVAHADELEDVSLVEVREQDTLRLSQKEVEYEEVCEDY